MKGAIIVFICLLNCLTGSSAVLTDDSITWVNMEKHLMYAYSAYCTEDLLNWTCWWCLKVPNVPIVNVVDILYDNNTDTYGYIGYNNDSIIIGWRGTNLFSAENWITDFEFWQTMPYPNISNAYVHWGWYTVYTDLRSTLLPLVQMLVEKFPEKNIVTTGHILGGALSVLTAADLARSGYKNVEVWNYGCTRVGNEAFANYYNSLIPKSRRVVNMRDLVAHYPFEFLDYYHVATEIWFPSGFYNFTVCNGGEDPNCSDSELDWSFADHTSYLGFDQNEGHYHGCGN